MGKAERGVLPVIASHRGRARGDRAFHWGQKNPRGRRGEREEVGRSQEDKGDDAAAEHFKGMIKDISHQFIQL